MAEAELKRRIRDRAFHIWLDEGRPQGRHIEHWQQAEKEICGVRDDRGEDLTPDKTIGEIKFASARTLDKAG